MLATVLASATALAQTPSPAPAPIDFNRDVHGILAEHCLVCHGEVKRGGGLSLATLEDILHGGRTGSAVKPGSSSTSLIIQRVTGAASTRMPQGGAPLSAKEIDTLKAWIDQGAKAAPGGAVAKARWEPKLALVSPPVPQPVWPAWSEPLDRLSSRYLAGHGAKQAPALVGDAEFARRAYLDIQGLLPDPDQLRTFLDSKDPGKRATLVNTLLADTDKYTDHWISFWNDLLRNDEGVAYYSETANRKTITPWLVNALRTNKPYSEWITQLLNPTKSGDPDGFLTGVNWRGTVSAAQTPAMQASQNTAQIFLGINFKCNSCHDSFISHWKLKDAYSLAAYFAAEEKLQVYRCDVAQPNTFATAAYMYPAIDKPVASGDPADRRAVLTSIFLDPRNGRVPRTLVNRIWTRLMGRGFVEDVDDLDGEPWSPETMDWLAADFVSHGYDLKHLIATIIASRTYQLPAVKGVGSPATEYVFRGPELRRLTAEQFADAVASVTGDWHVAPVQKFNAPAANGNDAKVVAVFSGAPVDGAGVAPRPAAPAAPQRSGGRGGNGTPPPPPPLLGGEYVREWRVAGSSLTKAMGRPIRDQVYTSRETQATTIQAIELVNGEPLTHWLWRGAQRMVGELPAEPKSLVGVQVGGSGAPKEFAAAPFSVDISNSNKLYLIVEDRLSTAPDKAAPVWRGAQLVGPNGNVPLASLTPLASTALRDGATVDGIAVKFPSVVVYDIAGKGFARFEGVPVMENIGLAQGENITSRFFVFDSQPSLDRLVPPAPGTPLPAASALTTIPQTVDRAYWYLFGRAPTSNERRIASASLVDPARPGRPSPQGLADLLWVLLMSPEFQFIR